MTVDLAFAARAAVIRRRAAEILAGLPAEPDDVVRERRQQLLDEMTGYGDRSRIAAGPIVWTVGGVSRWAS